jgi:lysozyme
MAMLEHDVETADGDVRAVIGTDTYEALSVVRRAVLVSMAFNMGRQRFAGFKTTIAAIKVGDYQRASEQMLNSLWARQVGERAKELAAMMRTGEWQWEWNQS